MVEKFFVQLCHRISIGRGFLYGTKKENNVAKPGKSGQ